MVERPAAAYTHRMPEPPSDDSDPAGPIEREETFASGFWNIKTAHLIAAPGEQASPRRLSLVIYHLEGVEVVPLVEGQPLLVGRQGSVDVCIGDKTLSRRHARFLLDNGVVEVEDQGSTNGTWVNGERITRSTIRVTDDIALGSVGVSLHATTPATARFGFDSHERFEVLLEHEVERARLFGRTVSLLMVEASRGKRLGRWCDRIRRLLRPVDRIALYGRGTVEVLLPEASVEQTRRLAGAIIKKPGPDEPPLRCGGAICPASATSAEELLEVCRAALRSTSARHPVHVVGGGQALVVPEVEVGEGPVISSPAMLELFDTVDRVANAAIPVLIVGETGTGKEVIARALHDRSDRRARPMRSVNCGAIPEQLLESTLFGHKKGAFTGADRDAPGMFVTADGATLLLDEIGELSASAQAALLRVIETKTVVPVGDTREIKVDVRIIAATHRNLEQMCEENAFRWDLLYRLNTMVLEVPPLRDRLEEIRPLALHFLGLTRAADGGVQAREINDEAMRALRSFDWPGNVRQLRNVIERAAVVAEGPTITLADLPERIRTIREGAQPEAVVALPGRARDRTDRMRVVTLPPRGVSAAVDAAVDDDGEGEDDGDGGEGEGLKAQVARFERLLIEDALYRTGGNQSAAAELLQMPRRTLAYRIGTLGVDPSGARAGQPGEEIGRDASRPYKDRVERFEAGLLREALDSVGGAAAEAARLLDMTSKAFTYKARKYGLK